MGHNYLIAQVTIRHYNHSLSKSSLLELRVSDLVFCNIL
jgi:hypothetical protein